MLMHDALFDVRVMVYKTLPNLTLFCPSVSLRCDRTRISIRIAQINEKAIIKMTVARKYEMRCDNVVSLCGIVLLSILLFSRAVLSPPPPAHTHSHTLRLKLTHTIRYRHDYGNCADNTVF